MYERTNGVSNQAFYTRSDRKKPTKDVVKYALRRENEGAEGDARVPQREEGPVDSCNQSRKIGDKTLSGDAHQMHTFVFSLFQEGVYPARITTLTGEIQQ